MCRNHSLVSHRPVFSFPPPCKVAACRTLPYDEFWKIFAENDIELLKARYPALLRPLMRNTSTTFWDSYVNKIKSFQYSGTSGWAAYYLFRWILPLCGLGFLRKCIIKEVRTGVR